MIAILCFVLCKSILIWYYRFHCDKDLCPADSNFYKVRTLDADTSDQLLGLARRDSRLLDKQLKAGTLEPTCAAPVRPSTFSTSGFHLFEVRVPHHRLNVNNEISTLGILGGEY